jgi:nucleoside-diphosphate-sugar epimerase
VYGFTIALQDSPDLFFNGQRDPSHAFMCGKGDEVDLTTPPHFTLIAVVVERSLLNPLWERMYQKPLAHWLEKQLVLPTTDIKAQNLRDLQLTVLDQASALAHRLHDPQALRQLRLFNLARGSAIRLDEAARLIRDASPVSPTLEFGTGTDAFRQPFTINTERLRQLGWQPRASLAAEAARLIKFFA